MKTELEIPTLCFFVSEPMYNIAVLHVENATKICLEALYGFDQSYFIQKVSQYFAQDISAHRCQCKFTLDLH